MLSSVLMTERTPVQLTRVWVLLMSGSEYMVEHRIFEFEVVHCTPIALKIWKGSLLNSETVAFQQDTPRQSFSPDPSSCGQKGLGLDYATADFQIYVEFYCKPTVNSFCLHSICIALGSHIITSPIEVFATGIKNLDQWKSSLIAWSLPSEALDCLIHLDPLIGS